MDSKNSATSTDQLLGHLKEHSRHIVQLINTKQDNEENKNNERSTWLMQEINKIKRNKRNLWHKQASYYENIEKYTRLMQRLLVQMETLDESLKEKKSKISVELDAARFAIKNVQEQLNISNKKLAVYDINVCKLRAEYDEIQERDCKCKKLAKVIEMLAKGIFDLTESYEQEIKPHEGAYF